MRVSALEWGELALIIGGAPENSAVGRSRNEHPIRGIASKVPLRPGDPGCPVCSVRLPAAARAQLPCRP